MALPGVPELQFVINRPAKGTQLGARFYSAHDRSDKQATQCAT